MDLVTDHVFFSRIELIGIRNFKTHMVFPSIKLILIFTYGLGPVRRHSEFLNL